MANRKQLKFKLVLEEQDRVIEINAEQRGTTLRTWGARDVHTGQLHMFFTSRRTGEAIRLAEWFDKAGDAVLSGQVWRDK